MAARYFAPCTHTWRAIKIDGHRRETYRGGTLTVSGEIQLRRLTVRRASNLVYSTPRREGWMLLVASCIYVCFMSACILHLRRCHVWWLSSVLSLCLSPFSSFQSIREPLGSFLPVSLFTFVSSPPLPPYVAARSATMPAFLDISQTRAPPRRGH